MLERLGENLYGVSGTHAMMGLPFPVRSTVIRLRSGIVVVSPIDFDAQTVSAIDELGPVSHLVAPNSFHFCYLAAAKIRWPTARVAMPAGLAAKRPELPDDIRLDGQPVAEWNDELAYLLIDGAPTMGEAVFLHRESGTLIACDLAFNIRSSPSIVLRTYLRLNRAYGCLAQTKVVRMAIRDRQRALASLQQVFEWPWDRLIVAHGEVLDRGAKAELRRATAWLT